MRACLTINYHRARAAPTRLLLLEYHAFFTGRAVFVASLLNFRQPVSNFIVLYGNQLVHLTLKTFPVSVHKWLHECHNCEMRCLVFIIAQIIFPLKRLSSVRETKRLRSWQGSHPLEYAHIKMFLISLKIAGMIATSATWEVKHCLYFPLLFDECCAGTKNRTFPLSDCTILWFGSNWVHVSLWYNR